MNENFKDIISAALSGDETAYEALYTMTKDSAYFVALSVTHNEQDALDILQESYIKAFAHLDTVDPPEYFDNWLNRIVSNCSKNFIKRKKPILFSDISENIHVEELNEETDTSLIPHEHIDKQEASRLIMEIINGLSENKRLVILMYYYQEMSTKEISEALELPLTTVKYYLLESRKQIKSELEKLDKEGTRLYAAIPFSLFPSLIGQSAGKITGPAFSAVSTAVMDTVNGSAPSAATAHAASSEHLSGGTNTPFKTTESKVTTAAKTSMVSGAKRIIAGVAAALVVGAGAAAVVLTTRNNGPEPSVPVSATESQNVSSEASADSSEVTEPSEEPQPQKQTVSEDFYGSAIKTDDGLFYWKYSSDDFSGDTGLNYKIGTVSLGLPNNVNQMVCRGADGKERVLFEKKASGKFAFCNGKFFYNSQENVLYSCDMDGKNEKNLGYIKLENVTDDGAYLICSYVADPNKNADDTIDDIYTLNTLTEEKTKVVQSGGYVGYHNDLIYYYYKTSAGPQPYQFDGQIQIRCVNIDGTDDRVLYTNDENLYDYTTGSSYVGQIYFGDEYIYFSFGATEAAHGAVIINLNGKIVRMKYDGSSAKVVAGEGKLVGPNFYVNDDGTVTVIDAPQVLNFVPLDNVRAEGTSIYMADSKTGGWMKVIDPDDYSIIGGDPDEEDNCYSISDVDMVGDKLYYLVIYAEKIHQSFIGREMVHKKACGFFEKDMTTGKVKVLYQF